MYVKRVKRKARMLLQQVANMYAFCFLLSVRILFPRKKRVNLFAPSSFFFTFHSLSLSLLFSGFLFRFFVKWIRRRSANLRRREAAEKMRDEWRRKLVAACLLAWVGLCWGKRKQRWFRGVSSICSRTCSLYSEHCMCEANAIRWKKAISRFLPSFGSISNGAGKTFKADWTRESLLTLPSNGP